MDATRSFLFVTWSGGGNVPAVLGLARRLVDRGHDVCVLTEPCLQESVLRAGCRFIPFTRHFTRTDDTEDIIRDYEGMTPIGSLNTSSVRASRRPAPDSFLARMHSDACEAFDFPITPAPPNVRYVGPILDDPDWTASSKWENPWPSSDTRPLVVVSLSSTFQNQRDALQRAITSLGELDVRGSSP